MVVVPSSSYYNPQYHRSSTTVMEPCAKLPSKVQVSNGQWAQAEIGLRDQVKAQVAT